MSTGILLLTAHADKLVSMSSADIGTGNVNNIVITISSDILLINALMLTKLLYFIWLYIEIGVYISANISYNVYQIRLLFW